MAPFLGQTYQSSLLKLGAVWKRVPFGAVALLGLRMREELHGGGGVADWAKHARQKSCDEPAILEAGVCSCSFSFFFRNEGAFCWWCFVGRR